MNHTVEKTERYALIRLAEAEFGGSEVPATFETVSRGLFREGFSNLILDGSTLRSVDAAGVLSLRKISRQCANELGILVFVTKSDDLTDELEDARIADLAILPTVEEAIDAVFMHELENDFRDDDEYDGEYGEGEAAPER